MRPHLALAAILASLACGGPAPEQTMPVEYQAGLSLSCPTADLTYFDFQNCEDPTGTVRHDCGITGQWWTWSMCRWDCASYCGLEPSMVYLWFVEVPGSGWLLVHEVVFPRCSGEPREALAFTCGA